MEEVSVLEKEFNIRGFPIIRLYKDYFEIKAIDFKAFRSFKYTEVAKIEYYQGGGDWAIWPIFYLIFTKLEPYKLKITKLNGGNWVYTTPSTHSKEFDAFISELKLLCRNGV